MTDVPELTIRIDWEAFPGQGTQDVSGALIDENGKELWHHFSSSRSWLENDLTTNFGDRKEALERLYPNGWTIKWDEPPKPPVPLCVCCSAPASIEVPTMEGQKPLCEPCVVDALTKKALGCI